MAGGLAAIVAVVCRFNRARPAFCHMLWLLVFAVLVMPPLPMGMGGFGIRSAVGEFISPPTTWLAAMRSMAISSRA
jgi:hypothetical protein